jgi:hypothetical protein
MSGQGRAAGSFDDVTMAGEAVADRARSAVVIADALCASVAVDAAAAAAHSATAREVILADRRYARGLAVAARQLACECLGTGLAFERHRAAADSARRDAARTGLR